VAVLKAGKGKVNLENLVKDIDTAKGVAPKAE